MYRNSDLNGLIKNVIESVRASFRDLETWKTEDQNLSKPYTARLYSQLHHLAERLGLDVRMTYQQPQNFEFLYDVCFLETSGGFNDRNGYFSSDVPLKRAILVLECEWSHNNEDILYDFSKLLMARSELRTIVFYQNTKEGFDSVAKDIKSAVTAYKHGKQSDRYLIIGLVLKSLHFVLINGEGNTLQLPSI